MVIRNWPFHSTLAPVTKPVPLIVSVKPGLPGAITVGLMEEMVGPLLAPMTKLTAGEAMLLVVTVTAAVPAVAIRFEGTTVVNCVALT